LEAEANWQQYLYPPDQIVAHLPQVVLDESLVTAVKQGRPINLASERPEGKLLRAYTPSNEFLAILKLGQANVWHPQKVFSNLP
jgi:tRNA U55 pseudouridine synthase TruB